MTTKHLSSGLTFLYKIIFPTFFAVLVLIATVYLLWTTGDLMTLLAPLTLFPFLILIKIQQVKFDDENVYISNGRTKWTYQLKDIKAINEGSLMTLDPFFELEIIEKNGQIRKVDFMPKVDEFITYTFTGKLTGRLIELKQKIRDSKLTT